MANTSFSQMKKNRKSNFEKLNEELNKVAGKQEYKDDDDRFWYPAVDKAGNGYAVIRFLPAPEGEDVPFVRLFTHGFQGKSGSWYIENSLTTLGRQDPVSEYNSKLWNSGVESDKDIARKQKRKLNYISNIYVVQDPANPENEGKVFLFRYGKKIFDKLYEANNPKFPDETPIDPFDLWGGANLKIKIRNVEGYRNYDASSFEAAKPLFDDDKAMEEIWKEENSLSEFVDPKKFKSYEELKAKFHRVIGLGEDEPRGELPDELPQPKPRAKAAKSAPSKDYTEKDVVDSSEDEGDLNFFRNLANDDEEGLIA